VERQGRIEVSAEGREGALFINVVDNGPGIPSERLAAIFDPYFTTKPEGSGLGLWIAQQIVIAHGGSLKAENAPGGGAVFIMRMPVSQRRS
jgi:two-component system sensor histidine kinase HydH